MASREWFSRGRIIGIKIERGSRLVLVAVEQGCDSGCIVELDAQSWRQHISYRPLGSDKWLQAKLQSLVLVPSTRELIAWIQREKSKRNFVKKALDHVNAQCE